MVATIGVSGFKYLLLLSLMLPVEIWCQIGRGYQQNHPNHVLGSQLRYQSVSTTVETPQTGIVNLYLTLFNREQL